MSTEVWITGCGAVSAAGRDSAALDEAVRTGRSGVRPLAMFGNMPGGAVAEVPGDRNSRRLDRAGQLFVAAAEAAWQHAGSPDNGTTPDRTGLIEGSSLGPLAASLESSASETSGRRRPRATDIVRLMPGAGGAAFAQAHGIHGPVLHISAGSLSATSAIGEAFDKIANGRLDLVVTGGAECPFHPSIVSRFVAAGLIDVGANATACRPFDSDRQHTVLGEGAGALVLESLEHAMRRGAHPLAVIRGYGVACEAHSMSSPDPHGRAVTMAAKQALGHTGAPVWIKTHGTGTRPGDASEYEGLCGVFGSQLAGIPITSLKPLLGHCLGASGSVETVAAVLALQGGFIPPTLGTEDIDKDFPYCDVVTQTCAAPRGPVLLLSQGLGGRAAALVIAPA
jgi:3-oxoacyl-[acyl-carrier-protein] synthase II